MATSTSKNRINEILVKRVLLVVGVVACLVGCGHKEEAPITSGTSEGVVRIWPSTNAAPADRLEWNRKTLVKAYDRVGERDSRWDESARAALEAFARLRCEIDTNADSQLKQFVARAREAACTDPLIAYLNLRISYGDASDANTDSADAYRGVADRLLQSNYPGIRKFYGALRAAEAWKSAHGNSSNTAPVLGQYHRVAFHHLLPVLRATDTPFVEAYQASDQLRRAISFYPTQEGEILPVLIECFKERWPSEARGLTLRGQAYVQVAWNRRGSGYADSVTEEGWKEFNRNLGEAERYLDQSWALDPTILETALAMMEVELGQGRGRDRMELWFDRAMSLDPACYAAAYKKAWYLQPKWHGSARDVIAFGRECVASKTWKGRVPLMLWDAHRMLANDKATGLKDAYWKQAGVWDDVHDSFERFFELNPDWTGWRHDYAMYAYKCEQFDKFLDLLPQMGSVNYRYFGGEQQFAKMVGEAEQKTGRKAKLPGK